MAEDNGSAGAVKVRVGDALLVTGLRIGSILLFVVLVAVTCWIVLLSFTGVIDINEGERSAGRDLLPRRVEAPKEHHGSLFYESTVAKRDIFLRRKRIEVAPVANARGKKKAVESLKSTLGKYELQGILWGTVPKVIIKEKRGGSPLFLREGQMIKGSNIKVSKINRRHIELRRGHEVERME